MSRVLITGGSGDLGRPLSALAARSHVTVGTYLTNPTIGGGTPHKIDLTNRSEVFALAKAFQPDVIIHTALSDRSIPDHLLRAAEYLTQAALDVDARLIVISTDMVFNGKSAPYRESDPPTPVLDYGKVKAAMESHCLASHPNCVIVRTSLIYDFHSGNRQISWMLDRLSQDQPIRLFIDEIRNPVYAWNLAEALLELGESNYCGLLHFAGSKSISRYDLGCYLLKTLGHDPLNVVEAVEAEKIAAQRPRDLSFDLSLAQSILQTAPVSIEQAYSASKS